MLNEGEAGLRQVVPTFSPQHQIELLPQLVQPEYVSGRVPELLGRKHLRAPVGTLLFLQEVDADHLAA